MTMTSLFANHLSRGAALLPALFLFTLASAQPPANPPRYLNPDLPAEQRAADLVSRMTLEEKVLQMQNAAPAIPRLNVPEYDWWNEALHGVARAGDATVFPQAIGLAATWDTKLMHRIADIISTEARAKYNQAIRDNNHRRYYGLTFWSPNINIFRDPRWGRGQETYGEDPFLTGRLAVEFIHGMQGDDPHYFKVIATAKHYAVHSGPEPLRHEFDVHPSARDLNDTYLPAFRAAIMEGKADSVMCAYNAVDGVPACANTDLLQKYLRKDWGFQGYVVSDCAAIRDIFVGHKYKADAAQGSAAAVKAGTDLTCGNEYRSLVNAVKSGLIKEAEIDSALERLFVARFKLGMFDPPARVPFSKIPYSEVDSEAHRQAALDAARESIVLLKNENDTLPFESSVTSIAVLGPAADDPEAPMGNYNGFSKRLVTPLAGIERQFRGKAKVQYSLGSPYTPDTPAPIPASMLSAPGDRGPGVLEEFFAGEDYQGEPKVSRVVPRPVLQPDMAGPAVKAAFPKGGYSVRWTGTLHAPVSGKYLLVARGGVGSSAMHLFLDDKEVMPEAEPAGTPAATNARRFRPPHLYAMLEAGHAYKFRAEFHPQGIFGGGQVLWAPPAEPLLAQAVETVKNSDVAVVFAGLNPNLEGEEMPVHIPGFSGGDRTDLNLPEAQEKLVEAAIGTGKPVVVVLTSGSALAVNYAAQHAAAVLESWYNGEEAGTAIAETLAGINNPAGRLPVTFYRGVDQLPPFEDYSMNGRTYRYFKGDPLYGFGFGLSYSKFSYSGLHTSRSSEGASISVRVKNDSKRDGDEVVQVYLSGPGDADGAIRDLRGFERVHLKAGQSREVHFSVPAREVPSGKVKVNVGGGQPSAATPHVEGSL
jgi:beta-glucosidase